MESGMMMVSFLVFNHVRVVHELTCARARYQQRPLPLVCEDWKPAIV